MSFIYIFVFGIIFAKILGFFKIPDVVSMIIAGFVLKEFSLISQNILSFSSIFREFALVIILIRAGLSLDINKLLKVGRPAILMSFIPATFEILAISSLAFYIMQVPIKSSIILGCVISAVSPAIIVPRMIKLQKEGYSKNIPELILASASIDDIFVITLFYSILDSNSILYIPINLLISVLFGIIFGFILSKIKTYDIFKSGLILIFAYFLLFLENTISFSPLLSILIISIFQNKNPQKIPVYFNKIWSVASILLFVLVGASLDITYAFSFGFAPFLLILIALIFRLIGTYLCLMKTSFSKKERLFCIISFLPKATVQAGLGAIPLAYNLPFAELILSMSIISILITAPLGAFLIDNLYKKLLQKL